MICAGCGASKLSKGGKTCWYCDRRVPIAAPASAAAPTRQVVVADRSVHSALRNVELRGSRNVITNATDCLILGDRNLVTNAVRCEIRGNRNVVVTADLKTTVVGDRNVIG